MEEREREHLNFNIQFSGESYTNHHTGYRIFPVRILTGLGSLEQRFNVLPLCISD